MGRNMSHKRKPSGPRYEGVRAKKALGQHFLSDEDIANAALAVDNIDIASSKKIPLWAFGFLY